MHVYKGKKDKAAQKLLKKRKQELINIIRYVEPKDYERNQRLHDMAYSIVQRMITDKFDCLIYDVILDYDMDQIDCEVNSPAENCGRMIGWNLLHNEVYSWRPDKPRKDWTPIEKEIVHVLLVKDKIISQFLLENINKSNKGVILKED